MTETDAFSRAIRRKSWRKIFSRTCRPLRSSLLNLQKEGRRGWIGIGRKELRKESSAIFLFLRPRSVLAFVKTIASLPLSLSLSLSPSTSSVLHFLHLFRHTLNFFLFVRAADGQSASGFDIKKVSLSLSLSLSLSSSYISLEAHSLVLCHLWRVLTRSLAHLACFAQAP